jgi:type VI secretion system FHA domain protein
VDPLGGDDLDDPFGGGEPGTVFHHPVSAKAPPPMRRDDPFDTPGSSSGGFGGGNGGGFGGGSGFGGGGGGGFGPGSSGFGSAGGARGHAPDPDDDLFRGVTPADNWTGGSQRDNVDAPQGVFLPPKPVAPVNFNEIDFDALLGDDLPGFAAPAKPAGGQPPATNAPTPGWGQPLAPSQAKSPPAWDDDDFSDLLPKSPAPAQAAPPPAAQPAAAEPVAAAPPPAAAAPPHVAQTAPPAAAPTAQAAPVPPPAASWGDPFSAEETLPPQQRKPQAEAAPPAPTAAPPAHFAAAPAAPTPAALFPAAPSAAAQAAPPPAPAPSAQQPAAQAAPLADAASAQALLHAFLEGAGVPELKTGPATEQTMRAAGAVFRSLVEGLRETLMSRAAIKNELRVEQTMLRARDNNALKFSVTAEEAVAALLLPNRAGYKPPLDATREAFRDIQSHEMAVMAGVQTALVALLKRFDPATLESRLAPGRLDSIIPSARRARIWELFCETYKDIAHEAEDDFQSVFGREFARAYDAQMKKL